MPQEPDIEAVVKDQDFLERVLHGRLGLPMQRGIEMDVDLETKERLIEGVWRVTERNIIAVRQVYPPPPPSQSDLFSDEGG